jgi:hypothetical protein
MSVAIASCLSIGKVFKWAIAFSSRSVINSQE